LKVPLALRVEQLIFAYATPALAEVEPTLTTARP